MIKVFLSEEDKSRGFEACIAALLEVDMDAIPIFPTEGAWVPMMQWMQNAGYSFIYVNSTLAPQFIYFFGYAIAIIEVLAVEGEAARIRYPVVIKSTNDIDRITIVVTIEYDPTDRYPTRYNIMQLMFVFAQ